jgi:hypothetical protein
LAIATGAGVSGNAGLLGVVVGGPGATRMSDDVEEDEWLDADLGVRHGPLPPFLRRAWGLSASSINSIIAWLMIVVSELTVNGVLFDQKCEGGRRPSAEIALLLLTCTALVDRLAGLASPGCPVGP